MYRVLCAYPSLLRLLDRWILERLQSTSDLQGGGRPTKELSWGSDLYASCYGGACSTTPAAFEDVQLLNFLPENAVRLRRLHTTLQPRRRSSLEIHKGYPASQPSMPLCYINPSIPSIPNDCLECLRPTDGRGTTRSNSSNSVVPISSTQWYIAEGGPHRCGIRNVTSGTSQRS